MYFVSSASQTLMVLIMCLPLWQAVFDQLLSEADRWEMFSRSSSAAVKPEYELHIYASTYCCEGH